MPLWAIGVYSVGYEECEMEMVLFVPCDSGERDPESQAVFKRGEYYSVGGKIVPNCYASVIRPKMSVATSTHLIIKDSDSNKCPLKVSFVGSPQRKISAIENTEDSVMEITMTDYVFGLDHYYIINTAFSHTNPRFEHLKSATNLQESVIFVVGQMEVIDGMFYVNAKDINYVNVKKRSSDTDSSQTPSASTNSMRSKLFNIHQNMTKNSKDEQLPNTSNTESGPSAKRKRTEDSPELENVNSTIDCEPEASNSSTKNTKP
ncbi:5556_t:CDS:2 [Cetraspora pellucida]|uniref:5556_t:CDS:1 n=1 Tax=Cetraspora pellucida TaxID=1433469 RepID=A0ACA9MY68_9GLOM|nr:5556_t:CDS:2 [Cetraspora pellucida]